MAYDLFLPDTSTRKKLLGITESFLPSMEQLNAYQQAARQQQLAALQQQFGAAQQSIGAQFTPAMRLAQARLGSNPLLADSGYANRLNRQLQQSAFGSLSNAYGQYAGEGANQLSQFYQNLLNQRMGARENYLSSLLGTAQKKKSFGDYLGGIVGTGVGAYAGSR